MAKLTFSEYHLSFLENGKIVIKRDASYVFRFQIVHPPLYIISLHFRLFYFCHFILFAQFRFDPSQHVSPLSHHNASRSCNLGVILVYVHVHYTSWTHPLYAPTHLNRIELIFSVLEGTSPLLCDVQFIISKISYLSKV